MPTRPSFLLLCLLAIAMPGSLLAATLPSLDDLRVAQETFVLDNGLRVVVHEDRNVPIVAVNLWYHVGSRDEKRGRTGFAHLFEHFFFNGSENYPHGFREAMDDLGANNRNGTTSTDRTNFFEDVPVSALERTLYLEADRMGWLAGNLSEAMLERERGVVKNEKRQGENRPYGQVFSRIIETIYPYSHPYSWSTIGSMEDLDAARMEDIREWYETWYGPNNTVLVLAGDIDATEARQLVQKYFGPIKPGAPVARQERWVPVLDADLRDTMQDRVPQTRIHRVWHLPPWGDSDTHALELFASVLSGSESAPLDRRLVFETQLATDVSAFVWRKELASNLIIQASVRPGADAAAVEREIESVLAGLLESGPSAADLDRARGRFFAGFTRGIERLGGRANLLAESTTFGGSPDAYLTRLETLATLDAARVRDRAREWLSRHHYTLTVTPFPTLQASAETIDRSQLPALGNPPDVAFPEVQRARLDNGLQVMLLERHSAPLVNVALAVDAGSAADPADAPGTARLALDLLVKGSATRDTFRIVDERDLLGASFNSSQSLDQSLFGINALAANLEQSLLLFADVVRNPKFPVDMVEIQRKQQLAGIAQERADPFATAGRVVPRLLYGAGHPYAAPASGRGDEKTVEELTAADLREWHGRWFRPNNATLIVAGATTMADLLPMLERSFGDWTAGDTPPKPLVDVTAPGGGKVHLIDRPGAAQSTIIAAHPTISGASDEDHAIETVMRNFGGIATSRLNRNLRLDKHWSYGTSGGISSVRGPRSFMVTAPVQTDRTADAMREVLAEIRGVAGERPLAGDEFESIQRNQTAALAGRFETLGALVAAATQLVNLDRDPAYYYDYAASVRALTPASVAGVSQLVRPDELIWVVIGDLRRVEAEIRALGFGEIVFLDNEGRPLVR
jgi:zinc protease